MDHYHHHSIKPMEALGGRLPSDAALAGCQSFEAIVRDLRTLLHLAAGREAQPSAVIFDGRTLHSTPESGHGTGYGTSAYTFRAGASGPATVGA
jgi:hypothetical protein